MIETSSDLLRSSSAIFANLWKMSGNLRKMFGTFVRHSGQFWKIFGNIRKMVGNLRKIVTFYIVKRKLHGRLEIRNFPSHAEKYFTRSLRSLVKYFSTLEDKFRISERPCNILYIWSVCTWRHQIVKFKTKELLKVLSSLGISLRGTKFISVYSFPAQ